MNIGLLVPGFSTDESDWCIPALRNLVASLARLEDLRVFALRYPYRAGRYDLFGARVTAIGGGARQGFGSAAVWSRALAALAGQHRRRPFHILHAFWAGETGALAAVAGRLLRVPVVVSLAGGELVGLKEIAYGGQLARVEGLKTPLALALASRVSVGSTYLLSLAATGSKVSTTKLRRIPLGADVELFRPPANAPQPSPPRLVQAASLVPVKDQTTLLRAVAVLRNSGHEFRLEIAGSGPLEPRLRAMARELSVAGRVAFRGEIPHDRLPAFYAGAAAYVQSSLHEAQGMALLEAAACGVSAIGTRVGALPELEPDAAVGCEPGDPEAMAAAMAALLDAPDRLTTMGAAARRRVESDYSLETCVERFRSLYAELE